jgi:hypothetical protein
MDDQTMKAAVHVAQNTTPEQRAKGKLISIERTLLFVITTTLTK